MPYLIAVNDFSSGQMLCGMQRDTPLKWLEQIWWPIKKGGTMVQWRKRHNAVACVSI